MKEKTVRSGGANDPAENLAEAWETLITHLRSFNEAEETDAAFPGEIRQDLCLSATYEFVKRALKATGEDPSLAAPLKQLTYRLTNERRDRRKVTKAPLDEATALLRVEAVACAEILMVRQSGDMKAWDAREFVAKRMRSHGTAQQIRDWASKLIPKHPTLDAHETGSYQSRVKESIRKMQRDIETGQDRKEVVTKCIEAAVRGYKAGR